MTLEQGEHQSHQSDDEQPAARFVEAIAYFPKHHSLVVTIEGGLSVSFRHTAEGLRFHMRSGSAPAEVPPATLPDEGSSTGSGPSHATDPSEQPTSPTVVIAGKLQSQPKEGRPDRQGKPTAWARFLGRIEGQEGATLLSASFHGRTREIALGLTKDAHITAQGYLHLRDDVDPQSRRLSSFSVIHLLQYPGKGTEQRSL